MKDISAFDEKYLIQTFYKNEDYIKRNEIKNDFVIKKANIPINADDDYDFKTKSKNSISDSNITQYAIVKIFIKA